MERAPASGPPISTRARRTSPTSRTSSRSAKHGSAPRRLRLADRRSELGAVELKRAAVEQRELAVAAREADLAEREEALEVSEQATTSAGRGRGCVPAPSLRPGSVLSPGRDRSPGLGAGALARGRRRRVRRRSGRTVPLPGDPRRCAYLVLGPRRSGSDGSSTPPPPAGPRSDDLEPALRLAHEEACDGDVVV